MLQNLVVLYKKRVGRQKNFLRQICEPWVRLRVILRVVRGALILMEALRLWMGNAQVQTPLNSERVEG